MGRIDACHEIAANPSVIFCTFGDALRVPGKQGSLMQARERGADVRVVYSPLDALQLARANPQRQVVFFALGFETTMPVTAVMLQQARLEGIQNFSVFCQHISLIPTLRSLLQQPEVRIDGFSAPGHVSMIIGTEPYRFISGEYHKPTVVTGFEPLDILQGVMMLIDQFCEGAAAPKTNTAGWCRKAATCWRSRRWRRCLRSAAAANGADWAPLPIPASA